MANFETIKIDKSMYGVRGKTLTQVLEELDPSDAYIGTQYEKLDAFSRQLKRFDIKVSGKSSDRVEKFFQTSDSVALFPEYVRRAVATGMEQANVLANIVATTTKIDGMDYRTITAEQNDDDLMLKPVNEGAYIPQTVIKMQENLVKLHKRGRMIVSSYEAIRFQRIDLFTVTLKQIGAYIAKSQLKDAVDVLLNGDGNNNACTSISVDTEGVLTYNDLLKLWAELTPYELNTILVPTALMQKILGLSEMKDATAGLNFQGTGKMVTPMGATLIHIPELDSDTIIGIDKNFALEMVQAGDVIVDYDKLIDRQLERATVSCITGFAKIFTDSAKKLVC